MSELPAVTVVARTRSRVEPTPVPVVAVPTVAVRVRTRPAPPVVARITNKPRKLGDPRKPLWEIWGRPPGKTGPVMYCAEYHADTEAGVRALWVNNFVDQDYEILSLCLAKSK